MSLTAELDTAPVFLPRKTRWVLGIDLGQSTDSTAIAALEHITGVFDSGSAIDRHCGLTSHLQKFGQLMHVRHLQRLPLGMAYPAQVQAVKSLIMAHPALHDAALVLDATGVGTAVADIFRASGLQHERVIVTGSATEVIRTKGTWHVGKTVLISGVDALLNTATLRFAAALTEAGNMRTELLDFRRHLGNAGRATYQARTGKHDDLVLAVSIAAWWASRKSIPPRMGRY